MAEIIIMDPVALKKARDQIEICKSDLDDNIAELKKAVNGIDGKWKSSAKDEFVRQVLEDITPKLNKFSNLIAEYKEEMDKYIQNMQDLNT